MLIESLRSLPASNPESRVHMHKNAQIRRKYILERNVGRHEI